MRLLFVVLIVKTQACYDTEGNAMARAGMSDEQVAKAGDEPVGAGKHRRLLIFTVSKPAQTRFWVLANNTFKAKATTKMPIGIDCGGTGNGSVKPINNRYKAPKMTYRL